MRSPVNFLLLIMGIVLFLSGCNESEEPETYWYNYGTYLNSDLSNEGFMLKMDNGDTIIPVSVDYVETGVEHGSRVIGVYTIDTEEGQRIEGKVRKVEQILTKDILQLTEENQDSIGNDQVMTWDENIWLSENHLNVIFGYYGGGTTHFINLVKPIGTQIDSASGRQILEFRHNANNDVFNYDFIGIVSFDIWILYELGMDTLKFLFKSEDYSGEPFTWEGTYVFDTTAVPAILPAIGEPVSFAREVK